MFVYDAVLEALLAAVTTISRSNFRSKFEDMLTSNGQQETPMKRQHNVCVIYSWKNALGVLIFKYKFGQKRLQNRIFLARVCFPIFLTDTKKFG